MAVYGRTDVELPTTDEDMFILYSAILSFKNSTEMMQSLKYYKNFANNYTKKYIKEAVDSVINYICLEKNIKNRGLIDWLNEMKKAFNEHEQEWTDRIKELSIAIINIYTERCLAGCN